MSAENRIIGLIKIFLSDFPEVPRMISSLSFRNLFKVNKIDKNTHTGNVSKIILGNSRKIYEVYVSIDTLFVVNRSICLSPWPNQIIPDSSADRNKKLAVTSLIAYVVNLDIFSIISIFC